MKFSVKDRYVFLRSAMISNIVETGGSAIIQISVDAVKPRDATEHLKDTKTFRRKIELEVHDDGQVELYQEPLFLSTETCYITEITAESYDKKTKALKLQIHYSSQLSRYFKSLKRMSAPPPGDDVIVVNFGHHINNDANTDLMVGNIRLAAGPSAFIGLGEEYRLQIPAPNHAVEDMHDEINFELLDEEELLSFKMTTTIFPDCEWMTRRFLEQHDRLWDAPGNPGANEGWLALSESMNAQKEQVAIDQEHQTSRAASRYSS